MSKKINRREFAKITGKAAIFGMTGATLLPALLKSMSSLNAPDIACINGTDYYSSTLKAVELLGGMQKFVPPGSKVGLLINSGFDVKGAYVNPDISLAIIKMCFDAGASEVCSLQFIEPDYWNRTEKKDIHAEYLSKLRAIDSNKFPSEYNEKDFVRLSPPEGAVALKEAEVVKSWLDCDVFINVPIAKHHMTTLLTGALKNTMGVNTRKSNVTFHLGSGVRNDPTYLAQCIVDLNKLRKTDLSIVDATEFIITNGPGGPGELKKPDIVLAGTDIVAIDAWCSSLLDYEIEDILTTTLGHEAGLGSMNIEHLNIMVVNL